MRKGRPNEAINNEDQNSVRRSEMSGTIENEYDDEVPEEDS